MAGAEETYRRWVREHRGIVWKISRTHAHSREDREDLSQEILLQLWRSVASFRGESAESTWVYKVALNTAMTWRRGERSNGRGNLPQEEPACPKPLPDDAAAEHELVEWLYGELATWSRVDRSLMLLYLDDLSYRSMSEILGISESNVGVKLTRLKRRLSERMKGVSHGPR